MWSRNLLFQIPIQQNTPLPSGCLNTAWISIHIRFNNQNILIYGTFLSNKILFGSHKMFVAFSKIQLTFNENITILSEIHAQQRTMHTSNVSKNIDQLSFWSEQENLASESNGKRLSIQEVTFNALNVLAREQRA